MTRLIPYFVVVLALSGLYIALYFTLVYYGVIKASSRLMPNVCRLEERACQTVLNTPYARVFGVPNSLLGVLYYAVVIALILSGGFATPLGVMLVVVAWFTVALGIFLIYSLFFIIKIPCPLCLTGHAINLILAALLTIFLSRT